MTRLLAILVLALIVAPAGCNSSSAPIDDGEATGALGDDVKDGYGCSNKLIRREQARCRQECPAEGRGVSQGVKYCKTDDPAGQGGNVQAPCACSPPQVGALGQPCAADDQCNASLLCTSGACVEPVAAPSEPTIDAWREYVITITSVKVRQDTPQGESWDIFGGMPDPKVCVGDACVATCPEAYECKPTGTLRVSGQSLLEGVTVTVWDDDTLDTDDLIATYAGRFLSMGVEKQLENGTGNFVTYRVDAVAPEISDLGIWDGGT